jgi:amidase
MPLGDPKYIDLKSLRVAFHTDNGIKSPTPETVAVVQKTARLLSEGGITVEEARPQGIEQAYEIMFDLFAGDGGAGIQLLLQMAGTTDMHPLMHRFLELARPRTMSTPEFCGVLFKWDMFRSAMLAFLEHYDAILCPVNAYPALPHGTSFDNDNLTAFSYTETYNLTGWPGAVVRGGTSPEGLPIGVQVVARPWREDVALAITQHIETATGGWRRPPL